MEKLTLKEIAGYLPYGLQILCNSEDEDIYISTMVGLHSNGIDDNFGNNWDLEVKPLLYPLEMLTKTIVHNGVEIIPIVELKKEVYEFKDKINFSYTKTFNSLFFEWYFTGNKGIIIGDKKPCSISFYQKLHELHFDLYGLLERNLAINKSTLNSK